MVESRSGEKYLTDFHLNLINTNYLYTAKWVQSLSATADGRLNINLKEANNICLVKHSV
jgi:hypothetical protein